MKNFTRRGFLKLLGKASIVAGGVSIAGPKVLSATPVNNCTKKAVKITLPNAIKPTTATEVIEES